MHSEASPKTRNRRKMLLFLFFPSSPNNNNNWAVAGLFTSFRVFPSPISECSNNQHSVPVMPVHVLEQTCSDVHVLFYTYIFFPLPFYLYYYFVSLWFFITFFLYSVRDVSVKLFTTVLFFLDDDDDVREDDMEYASNKNIRHTLWRASTGSIFLLFLVQIDSLLSILVHSFLHFFSRLSECRCGVLSLPLYWLLLL